MARYESESLFKIGSEDRRVCSHSIRVVFDSAADAQFDYLVPDELWPIRPGQRVKVPFGRNNKLTIGFCVGTEPVRVSDLTSGNVLRGTSGRKIHLKKVEEVVDGEALLDSELMELAGWVSSYYVCPWGQVLAAMVPGAVKSGAGVTKEKFVYLADVVRQSSQATEQVKGKKQKEILRALVAHKASSGKSAVRQKALLAQAGCSAAPLKNLVRKGLVCITEKSRIKSLPVIPERLSVKSSAVTLNEDQQMALSEIESHLKSGRFGVVLLHGVTDSGKTEVYIRAIRRVIRQNKTAIVLLPEIALTAQTVQRFYKRFKKIAVLHSALSSSQRNREWQKIKAGQADVVIGARSAVFAPVGKVGLIVVDEEHETSYKQDRAPRYHGRDVAIKRAQMANAVCILGSATPSLESLDNCSRKRFYTLVRLPRRVMNLSYPQMKLIDLREGVRVRKGIELISRPLAEQLRATLEKSEQAIFMLNRRGYSNFVFCPSCKHTLQCRNCDAALTFHKSRRRLGQQLQSVRGEHMSHGSAICHHCGAKMLVPRRCPLCGKSMTMIGSGSQRLEEELGAKFPDARVARIDSDSMSKSDYYQLLKDFGEHRIDILAGTQILAKGLHFPDVTLVGVINADTSLYMPDFRSNERTFQLISQVAGRAGRSEKQGTVYVQSFIPNQPAIQFAVKNDYEGFVKEELKHRQLCNLPPFSRMAVITLRDMKYERLRSACEKMRERIDGIIATRSLQVEVRGPLPAVISRIQRFHRMQIIVRSPRAEFLLKLFSIHRQQGPVRPCVRTAIDIDPVNLM